MRDIKAGDIVSVKVEPNTVDYEKYGDNKGVVREVRSIDGELMAAVDFFKANFLDENNAYYGMGHSCSMWGFNDIRDNTGRFVSVRKLKLATIDEVGDGCVEYQGVHIGDRIRHKTGDPFVPCGAEGTVVAIAEKVTYPIYIRYDERFNVRGGFCCNGLLSKKFEKQLGVENIESIEVISPIIRDMRGKRTEEKDDEACELVEEKRVEIEEAKAHKYSSFEKKCIEKIKKLLTF